MKTKIYIALVLVLVLAALAAGTTSAQGPQPPEAVPPTERLTAPEMLPPGEPEIGKPFGLRAPFAWPAAGVAGVEAAAIPPRPAGVLLPLRADLWGDGRAISR